MCFAYSLSTPPILGIEPQDGSTQVAAAVISERVEFHNRYAENRQPPEDVAFGYCKQYTHSVVVDYECTDLLIVTRDGLPGTADISGVLR